MPPSLPLPPGARYLTLPAIRPTGGSHQVADVPANYWFSALQPIRGMAPAGQRPRQYQIQPGANLIWQPKGDEMAGFWILREFADSCDLFRLALDTLEDRLCSLKWEIRLIALPGEKKKDLQARQAKDTRIAKLTNFWRKPDGITLWSKWARMVLEDMLVIDAGCIYKERDLKGKIASLRVIDGATINRQITDQGFTPPPPSVAYQQVLYGIPAFDLTTEDLTYVMRSPRTWKRYGFSQVEKTLSHIGIALRRQEFLNAYYTSGNMPEALCFLENLPIDRVKEVQDWFDTVMAGDLSKRRRLTFLPSYGGGASNATSRPNNIIFPKEVLLKDPLDEWLFQMFCYNLGVSPQAMLKMMNRASAQQSAESAEEEGLEPKANDLAEVVNGIMQVDMGFDDLEWGYVQRRETDVLKQMQIDVGYVNAGIITRNESRENVGKDKDPSPMADKLTVTTASGVVPVDTDDQVDQITATGEARVALQPDKPIDGNGRPNGKPQPSNGKKKAKPQKLAAYGTEQAQEISIDPAHSTPVTREAQGRLERALRKVFRRQKDRAAEEATRLMKGSPSSLSKSRQYDSVQFNIDPLDAKEIVAIKVEQGDFTAKGRETEPHVTVLFGLDGASAQEIEAITKGTGSIEIELGDFEAFTATDEYQPLVIRIENKKLVALHDALCALPHTDTHPDYKPHICVGYLKPSGVAAKYVKAGNPLKGKKITLSDLVLSAKDKLMVPLAKALRKDDEPKKTPEQIAEELYAVVVAEFNSIVPEAHAALEAAGLEGVSRGLLQITVSDTNMISAVNTLARDWAHERAAELIGMRYADDGSLVENPDAQWAISETTRDDLRQIVEDSFKQETRFSTLVDDIRDAGIFSESRAKLIAETEVSRAQVAGNWNIWERSGLVKATRWQVSSIHDVADECDDNDGQTVRFGEPFPSGNLHPPAHPRCHCAIVAVEFNE